MDAPDTTKPTGLRDQALLEVIYGAGLRVSEASNLRVTDLNLSTREIRVRGKGSKERVVLIGQERRRMRSHSTFEMAAPGLQARAAV